MQKSTLWFLIVFCLILSVVPVGFAQQSLQDVIEKGERQIRSKPRASSAVMEVGEPGSAREIRYEVAPAAMAAAAKSALVAIGQKTANGTFAATGMGFYAGPGGLILTLDICIGADDPILVMTTEGQVLEADYVASDDRVGVAVLDTDEDSFYLPLGGSESLSLMSRLMVMQPGGSDPQQWGTSSPAVQAVPCNILPPRPDQPQVDRPDFVEVDLALAPLFSGLPVLDPFGKVSGIYSESLAEVLQEGASSGVAEVSSENAPVIQDGSPETTLSKNEGVPVIISIEIGRRLLDKSPTTRKQRTIE